MKKDKSVSAGEHKPMPNAAELNRSAELLVRARTGRESAYCVVTFHSYTDHRTLYGEGFVASWWVNAIHVLSRDNDWYLLPDIELALDAAKKAARHFERVSTYGSSMAPTRRSALAGSPVRRPRLRFRRNSRSIRASRLSRIAGDWTHAGSTTRSSAALQGSVRRIGLCLLRS